MSNKKTAVAADQPTKKQIVLTCIAANPAFTNKEVAETLGKQGHTFTADQVAQVRSQETQRIRKQKEAELNKPLDLEGLFSNIPAINELGGAEAVLATITQIRSAQAAFAEKFGTLERAEVVAQAVAKYNALNHKAA